MHGKPTQRTVVTLPRRKWVLGTAKHRSRPVASTKPLTGSSTALFTFVFLFIAQSWCTASDYARNVRPLLEKRCFSCHGVLKQESQLRLDTGAAIRAGGLSGPAVIARDSTNSVLIRRITSSDAADRMPPEGAPLTTLEVELLKAWIDAGAVSPPDERPASDPRDHWAFRKPVRPPFPEVALDLDPGSLLNPIDRFIAVKYAELGLFPVGEADRPTLLRRVFLDLIGIPPTPLELQRFLADDSVDAYERVVEDLLQRPSYGERWGRHWMDVWRYSDWYGRRAVPDVMNSYPQIWRWRDWIVGALNEDKGYDQMIHEMLAADELFPTDDDRLVATGFLVRNWFKWNYESWMKDNVEHTAKAFLGITLNCAHCHDHKYDPLTQEEYFRFRAFFEPLELRHDRIPGLADPGPFQKYVYAKSYGPIKTGMIRVFDEKLDAPTYVYLKGDSRNRAEGKPPVSPGFPVALGNSPILIEPVRLPATAYYPGLKSFVRDDELAQATRELASATSVLEKSRGELSAAEQRLSQLRARTASPLDSAVTTGKESPSEDDTLVRQEQAVHDLALAQSNDSQAVAVARARLLALTSRISADDAKYVGRRGVNQLSRAASLAEKQLAYESAQLRVMKADKGLVGAQRKFASDPKAKAEVDKAQKELADARTALDAARTDLTSIDEKYTPLSPEYPQVSSGRRSALARWIGNRDNPLTARVAVNHMWLRHFDRGLVESTSNFGRNGQLPSHPELLDWLAVELMDHDWQMKHIHRLIVTSRTYRLSSGISEQVAGEQVAGEQGASNVARDRDNRWYWRAGIRRMEAEVVRDSLLACANVLDATIGGHELDERLGLTSRRRSLYFAIHGESKMQFLELFDAPDVCDCYRRGTSVRPQQALALANSDLTLIHSRSLADLIWRNVDNRSTIGEGNTHSGSADEASSAAQHVTAQGIAAQQFVEQAFVRILNRFPSQEEAAACHEFLETLSLAVQAAQPGELAVTPPAGIPAPSADPSQRAREALIRALFSHNDFVTIR